MRRSCLLGLTLFLLLGLLAACGEAPDKENPHLPASEACLTGRVAAVEGAQLLVASLEEGAGESDVYAGLPGPVPRGLPGPGPRRHPSGGPDSGGVWRHCGGDLPRPAGGGNRYPGGGVGL